jgi:hypothetical protein
MRQEENVCVTSLVKSDERGTRLEVLAIDNEGDDDGVFKKETPCLQFLPHLIALFNDDDNANIFVRFLMKQPSKKELFLITLIISNPKVDPDPKVWDSNLLS